MPDLVYTTGSGLDWRRNQGNNTFASAATIFDAPVAVQSFSVGTVDSGIRSLDADGDGAADLIVETEDCLFNPNDPYAPPECTNHYYLLFANALGHEFSATPENVHNTNFRIGDFNGDGLGDFMYINQDGYWSMRISTGTATVGGSPFLPTTNSAKVLIADYDGDGRDDALRPDGNTLYIYRSDGSGFPSSATTSFSSPGIGSATAFVADVDGSGNPEIAFTSGSAWAVYLHASELADVVTAITDGLDRAVEVEYESLATTAAYTRDLGHSPSQSYVRRYGGSRHVVTTETHDDGIGGTRDITHEYDTAFVNTAGRGGRRSVRTRSRTKWKRCTRSRSIRKRSRRRGWSSRRSCRLSAPTKTSARAMIG